MSRKPPVDGRPSRGSLFFLIPWLDGILLVAATVFFLSRLARVPSQTVDLPRAPFAEGTRSALSIVMRARPSDGELVVFFADERLLLSDESQRRRLQTLLRAEASARGSADALLYADETLSLGKVLDAVSVFREAGLERVSFVTRRE